MKRNKESLLFSNAIRMKSYQGEFQYGTSFKFGLSRYKGL